MLFCTRKNGWGWHAFCDEVNQGEGKKFPLWLRGYMTYVLPLIIVVIYLKGYYDTFVGMGIKTLVLWMAFALLLLAGIFLVAFHKSKVQKK